MAARRTGREALEPPQVALRQVPSESLRPQRTQIFWQTAEGQRTPARRDDVETAPADVWINIPSLLAAGDPPVVPAMRIILDPKLKKPR